ncbi:hypothetical protein SK128_027749 [Halocaridina rubra]|uniref:Solute carrier organic anion transporter family member n=1 Tax=Halocaridina rubra TaxID=373956 RepID=A0AAN9AGU2_HALRR
MQEDKIKVSNTDLSQEHDTVNMKGQSVPNGKESDIFNDSKEDNNEEVEEGQALDLPFTEEELEETRCGIGPCKPAWLQRFATKEAYMLVYCMVGVVQGLFFTYSVSVISTIEKRFKLTSKQTGILMSGNDIAQIIFALFLAYYGNFGHRPRWLGIGAFFSAASSFTAAMPHLLFGPGEDAIQLASSSRASNISMALNSSATKEELCHFQPSMCDGQSSGESMIGSLILLLIAQFFVGISISIFFSLGVSYMDDNINKKSYPLYYTASLLLRIMGPVLGFLVGGKCLSIWIDPSQKPNISKQDPRWLGAWWLGYLFIGFGIAIAGCFLFFFPRKLPSTLRRERKRMARQVERDQKEGGNRGMDYFAALAKSKKNEAKPSLANLLKALKRLFTNEIWVGNLFNSTVTILALSGYWDFKPKYLENQFRKSAAEANYYTGMASLFVSVVGAVISGVILRWVRPGPRFVTGYNIFITIFSAAGFFVLIFIGCPKLDVIGPVEGSILPSCSSACGCTERYAPVCSQDKVTLFYSPCYAGCTAVDTSATPIILESTRTVLHDPVSIPQYILVRSSTNVTGFQSYYELCKNETG